MCGSYHAAGGLRSVEVLAFVDPGWSAAGVRLHLSTDAATWRVAESTTVRLLAGQGGAWERRTYVIDIDEEGAMAAHEGIDRWGLGTEVTNVCVELVVPRDAPVAQSPVQVGEVALGFCPFRGRGRPPDDAAASFVRRDKTALRLGDESFHFLGANMWFGMLLGAADLGLGGGRPRLLRELDRLQGLGVKVVRAHACGEGGGSGLRALQPAAGRYEPRLLEGLDFLTTHAGQRGMKLMLVLSSLWPWAGGLGQYLAWAGITGAPALSVAATFATAREGPTAALQSMTARDQFARFGAQFFSSAPAIALHHAHVAELVGRRNSFSGLLYRDDPAILGWELCEGVTPLGAAAGAFERWVAQTAALVKRLDPLHLVAVGGAGLGRDFHAKEAQAQLSTAWADANVDVVTAEVWPQAWGWHDSKQEGSVQQQQDAVHEAVGKAAAYLGTHVQLSGDLGKPLILTAFSLGRDPKMGTSQRDTFFSQLLEVAEMSKQVRK